MTENDLIAIERRISAATDGPWVASVEGRDHDSGSDFIGTGTLEARGPDLYVFAESVPVGATDLDFIAHARQDVPRLLAEVRRLRQLIAR